MDKNRFANILMTILDGSSSANYAGDVTPEEVSILNEFKASCSSRNLTPSNFPVQSLLSGCVLSLQQRVEKLAEDLLEITALESGNARIEVEHLNIKSTILEVMEQLHDLSAKKQLRLTTHLDSQPLKIHADARLVRQAILQLLFNAVEYAPYGSTIEVLAKGLPQEVMVSVKDNGRGMSSNGNLMFNRFCDSLECSDDSAGIGIGLNLVKNIVRVHGGRAWVESVEGYGCKVSFCMPRELLCDYSRPRKILPLFS